MIGASCLSRANEKKCNLLFGTHLASAATAPIRTTLVCADAAKLNDLPLRPEFFVRGPLLHSFYASYEATRPVGLGLAVGYKTGLPARYGMK